MARKEGLGQPADAPAVLSAHDPRACPWMVLTFLVLPHRLDVFRAMCEALWRQLHF